VASVSRLKPLVGATHIRRKQLLPWSNEQEKWKKSAAAVYRKFINAQKKITAKKRKNA
jgi:hypothetical protein